MAQNSNVFESLIVADTIMVFIQCDIQGSKKIILDGLVPTKYVWSLLY